MSFSFNSFVFDQKTRSVALHYTLVKDSESFTFSEQVIFPEGADFAQVPQNLLENIGKMLHLVLGVSYFKLAPSAISLSYSISQQEARFLNLLYTEGLGEFYFRNNTKPPISLFTTSVVENTSVRSENSERTLLGFGGGKESIVALELLRKNNLPFTPFIVETQKPHELSRRILLENNTPFLTVSRILDPQLFLLSKRGGFLNGHVPISAIIAALGVACAAFMDYKFVAVGNEAGSDEGNTKLGSMNINHQWSKSSVFETAFGQYLAECVTQGVSYFSLLRPLGELAIVREFANYPQYFAEFSSCNRNFKINAQDKGEKWCGECAKCASVFILLAAVLGLQKTQEIFKKNLLENLELIPLYAGLVGLTQPKPFDCVATYHEMKYAFLTILRTEESRNTPVIQWFIKEVLPGISTTFEKDLKQEVFTIGSRSTIPAQFQQIYDTL